MSRAAIALMVLALTVPAAWAFNIRMKTSSTVTVSTTVAISNPKHIAPQDCPVSLGNFASNGLSFDITSGKTPCVGTISMWVDATIDGTARTEIPLEFNVTVRGITGDYDDSLGISFAGDIPKVSVAEADFAVAKSGTTMEFTPLVDRLGTLGTLDLGWAIVYASTFDADESDIYLKTDNSSAQNQTRLRITAGSDVATAEFLDTNLDLNNGLGVSNITGVGIFDCDTAGCLTGSDVKLSDSHTGVVIYSDATAATHDTGTLVCTIINRTCVTTYTLAGVTASCSNDYNTGSAIPFQAVCR